MRSAAPGSEDETFGKAPSSAARQRRLGNKEDGEDAVTPRTRSGVFVVLPG